ncbi:MAG: hypothetical protein ACI3ZB_08280 [Prevotella sp.]
MPYFSAIHLTATGGNSLPHQLIAQTQVSALGFADICVARSRYLL